MFPHQASQHSVVDSWIASRAVDLPPRALRDLYRRALEAVCQRAMMTLGETTWIAIIDRVLSTSTDRYPWLSSVTLAGTALDLREIPLAKLSAAELGQGLRDLLIEVLSLLGVLTGDALTPQLHIELNKIERSAASQQAAPKDRLVRRQSKKRTSRK